MTHRLLGTLAANKVPAVGFVNEGKLGPEGSPSAERVARLREWRDAGFELGNHTFGHLDFHRVPLAEFEEDVVRGEPVTRSLQEERGERLRWFRHPFLHTGTSLPDKLALEAFLSARGYRIAPVTIDNGEWIFAKGYASALDARNPKLAERIRRAYVRYMESKLDYFERQSAALFGREIRQVLLVHANSLNADHFGEVLRMMRRRGYAIVSLDRALEDPAYTALPDTFTGRGGITWLHRWALSSGRRPLPGEPKTPPFVLTAAGVDGE